MTHTHLLPDNTLPPSPPARARASALLGLSLLLGACTGLVSNPADELSPDDPAEFSSRMFDSEALARFSPEERAYVQGHAIAVYLYGKTLPPYVGGRGYSYHPGVSSPNAAVAYDWDEVMLATSGGRYGNGPGAILSGYGHDDDDDDSDEGSDESGDHDDDDDDLDEGDCHDTPPPTCDPLDPNCEPPTCDPLDPNCEPPTCDPLDPTCTDPTPCDPLDPTCTDPTPCDPLDPTCADPGTGTGGGTGTGDPSDDCDLIDDDCEEFLDPAAYQARQLLQQIDVAKLLGPDMSIDDRIIAAFHRGMAEALYLEDLNEDTRHSEVQSIKTEVQDEGLCTHSPLVLDLAGDGLAISTVAQGVGFDLLAKGNEVRTAWIQDDDALLVLDRNGDGLINDGSELFGNSAQSSNGFAALAVLDSVLEGGNGDGVLDHRDLRFSELQVWNDTNRDGVSADELRSLAEVEIGSIDLRYQDSDQVDEAGNGHRQRASFVRRDGTQARSSSIVDVWFRFHK